MSALSGTRAYLLGCADGNTRLALTAYPQGWTGVLRDRPSSTSDDCAQRVLDLQAQLVTTMST